MRRSVVVIALCVAVVSPARAACTVETTPVAFGAYQSGALLATDSTGTVVVACGGLTSYSVAISAGIGGSASNRAMASGANRLAYNLYLDLTRLAVWGDGTGGSNKVAQVATGATLSVFGRIPGVQHIASGTYGDSLIVTVDY